MLSFNVTSPHVMGVVCTPNATNGSAIADNYDTADTYTVLVGLLLFLGILPLLFFDVRSFPVGATMAALFGALLMVVFRVVHQDDVYSIIGDHGNMAAILLLLAILMMAQYLEREQLLVKVLRALLKGNLQFENYLWRVCLVSFLLSALISSDAGCAILTPLLLKMWETQERPRTEAETLLLAVGTMANIGGMMTVFGNVNMALIAAKTGSSPLFAQSQLHMRRCVMFLFPPAIVAFFINLAFLLLHHRIRTRRIECSRLISEPSRSEQEMAGLTARENNNTRGASGKTTQVNGYIRRVNEGDDEEEDMAFEGTFIGPATQFKEERMLNPCTLETIIEDEVLEISSHSPSLRDDSSDSSSFSPRSTQVQTEGACAADDSSSSGDSDDDLTCRDRQAANEGETLTALSNMSNLTNLNQLSMEYRPSPLQSQPQIVMSASSTSLGCSIDTHGVVVSKRLGLYRSTTAVSAAEFLPPDTGLHQMTHSVGVPGIFAPGDSVAFQFVLCFLYMVIIALLFASTFKVNFNTGLVPLGVATLAFVADAILNRRPALQILKRVDWSVFLLFVGLFVWIAGFNRTRIPRWLWDRCGLAGTSYRAPQSVLFVTLMILVGVSVLGGVPLTLLVLDNLSPCADELPLVLYLSWVAGIAGNLTLYASTANLIVGQKAQQTIKNRLSFWSYLQFGLPTSLIICPLGVIIIYGLLRIPGV